MKEIQKHHKLLSSLPINIFGFVLNLTLLIIIIYSNNALALFNLFPCLLLFLYIIPFLCLNPLLILLDFMIFFPRQDTEQVYFRDLFT